MSKSIIFLDFDGVLCNSVKEAYILARYVFSGIDVHKEIEDNLYSVFTAYRYLISNSWQYYCLIKLIFNKEKEIPQKFYALIKDGKNEETELFNHRFLAKRKELMEKDFDFWNSLETPTPFLSDIKEIIKNTKNCTFAILSTKNSEAITEKFKFWNITFDKKFIFDKGDLNNISKGEFIKDFLNSHIEYNNAILIDDNEDNINSCRDIEHLQTILTSWGYVNNPKNAKTEQEIIKIIKEYV